MEVEICDRLESAEKTEEEHRTQPKAWWSLGSRFFFRKTHTLDALRYGALLLGLWFMLVSCLAFEAAKIESGPMVGHVDSDSGAFLDQDRPAF